MDDTMVTDSPIGATSVMEDLAEALESINEAESDYEEAGRYYAGDVEEKFLTPLARKLLTGSSRDFQINLISRVVDAVLDRLEIGALTAEPITPNDAEAEDGDQADDTDDTGEGESEPEEMTEATRVLNQLFWHDNELDLEAPEIHEKALSLGDAYLFVWPELDTDGKITGVEVYYNSPLSVRVLYDVEKPRRKRLAIKRWQVGAGKERRVRVNLYYPGPPGFLVKLISKKETAGTKAADFEPHVDEHTDENGVMPFPWDWEELPFFHFRTARPYGRPEHWRAYGAQDASTKLIKSMMSAVDFSVFPQRAALAETGASTDDDADWGDDEAADPQDHQSQMIAHPGGLWILRNIKDLKEFSAADIDQFLKPLNWVLGGMAAVTGTPMSQFRQLLGAGGQMPSGESQRQDKDSLLKKTNARQLSFASTWRAAAQFALRLLGIDATVTIHWRPPEIIAGKEAWEGVRAQQNAGVPVRQTLLEAGYTEAEVTSWGYTEEAPDGPGIDLSQFAAPPPVPGAANPFGQQPALAAAGPPAAEGEGQT